MLQSRYSHSTACINIAINIITYLTLTARSIQWPFQTFFHSVRLNFLDTEPSVVISFWQLRDPHACIVSCWLGSSITQPSQSTQFPSLKNGVPCGIRLHNDNYMSLNTTLILIQKPFWHMVCIFPSLIRNICEFYLVVWATITDLDISMILTYELYLYGLLDNQIIILI